MHQGSRPHVHFMQDNLQTPSDDSRFDPRQPWRPGAFLPPDLPLTLRRLVKREHNQSE